MWEVEGWEAGADEGTPADGYDDIVEDATGRAEAGKALGSAEVGEDDEQDVCGEGLEAGGVAGDVE